MSSPIETDLLAGYCPKIRAPYAFGLNIGCGDRQIGESVGVDYRETAKAAKIVADARELPIADDSADYVVSCHCLEHLRDGPLAVLREWIRVLKPGCPMAIAVPDGSEEPLKMLSYQVPAGRFIPGQHVSIFTVETLRAYLIGAGLENVKVESVSRMPYWKTKVLVGTGVKGSGYRKDPYRWRAWTWAKEVFADLPIGPRMVREFKDWHMRRIGRALFGK